MAVAARRDTATQTDTQIGFTLADLPGPGRFMGFGFAGLASLLALSSLGVLLAAGADALIVQAFHKAFWVDTERNLATLTNFALLLMASGLLGLAAWATRRAAAEQAARRSGLWHWAVLGVVFFLMAFDEAASLHEMLMDPVRETLGVGRGFLNFAWVIPGVAFVAVMVLAYARFVLALPRRVGVLLVLSGALYVGGAIGFEMVGSYVFSQAWNMDQPAYWAATTMEEGLEMAGLIVLSGAVLTYLHGLGQHEAASTPTARALSARARVLRPA